MTEKDTTTVHQAELSIDEILGTPSGANIIVPDQEDKPATMFSRPAKADISFLDKQEEQTEDKSDESKDSKTTTEDATTQLNDLVAEKPEDKEDSSSKKAAGRPTNLVELGTRLIEKGILVPFEGEEDVSKYTLKDWEELFESNESAKKPKLKEEVSVEFYEGLPEEFQYAAHYFANGGKDLKGLFKSLAAVEEIRQLDVTDESSQEQIIRSYLHATNFGTAEDIEEEIDSWKDRDELENKAKKFKPKLDAMQEQIVARQLQQQEGLRKQQQKQAALYTDNIYKTLEPGDLNGLKLDKKTQNLLFSGLTQANYPSMSGSNTNLLGHLLEKYQYGEPNHSLISEALWLLADPEGYKAKVKAVGGKDQVEKTVRVLKTEQSNKSITTQEEEDDNPNRTKKSTGIQRPAGGFFQRNK